MIPRREELHLRLRHFSAIAKAQQHRGQRDVDVHVRVANAEALCSFRGDFAAFEHAGHDKMLVAHLDRVADWLLGREEP